jgi:predicted 3-demethylubiquinone-9 3-methyltransferase (glyoxalase superfamily)
MIHTDEDDEFARIERENSMKGQPYNWEANAIKAAIRMEREECAKIADKWAVGWYHPSTVIAEAIRARDKNDTR